MSYTILRPETRDEWLEIRKSGIGSSEVSTILGLNPFETPYQLWRRKLGMDAPKVENQAMKAGHYLEDAVARFFTDATSAHVVKRSAGDWIMRDNERPYLQVSPDRTFWRDGEKHNEANKGILEIKTTQLSVSADDVPTHWFIQLQYQLGVAGYTHGALAWLTRGMDFDWTGVEFDADVFDMLCERVERFWVDNILGRKEPELVSAEDVVTKYPREIAGKTLAATEQLVADIERVKAVKAQIKELEAEEDALTDAIKVAMADNELLVSPDGRKLATYKAAKDGFTFDKTAFSAENPELYQKYLKQKAGARTLLIKK